jgi:hypothetical protein
MNEQANQDSCKDLASAIGGGIILLGFIVSEILPFTDKVKAQGLLHFIAISILKYYKKQDDEGGVGTGLLSE